MEKRGRLHIVTLSYACSTIAATVPAKSRLRIKEATLELTNVRKEDCGLQLQCQIFPKLMGRMASERTAQFYSIKISAVLPKGQSTSLFHRSWVNVYFLMWELRKPNLQQLFYSRGGSRIFFRRGCTRLLLYFNTNKPHSFFFCRIPVVLENRRSSQPGGGVADSLHPPPRSTPVFFTPLVMRVWL